MAVLSLPVFAERRDKMKEPNKDEFKFTLMSITRHLHLPRCN